MITAKRHSSTGEFLGYVHLNLNKSLATQRLMQALAKSEARPGDVTYRDLDALQGNSISLDRLAKLFSREELRRAAHARRTSLDVEAQELDGLLELLDDPDEWRAAQGRVTRKK